MNTFTLQNQTFQLKFNRQTGALVEIFAQELDWPILTPAHLGLSFRLLVPLSEERRNNPVFGEKQILTGLEVISLMERQPSLPGIILSPKQAVSCQ